MRKKILVLVLFVLISLSILMIPQVQGATDYTSSLQFNNTIDYASSTLNSTKATVRFTNNANSSVHGTYSLNSSGGYKLTGVGNATSYTIEFFWDWYGTTYKIHEVDVTTSDTSGTNNTFGAYTIQRLVQNVNSSGIAFLSLPISATINSISYSSDVFASTYSASVTTTTRIYVGAVYDNKRPKVFIDGHQTNEGSGWMYDSGTEMVTVTWAHSSSVTVKLDWTEQGATGSTPSEREPFSPLFVIIIFLILVVVFIEFGVKKR